MHLISTSLDTFFFCEKEFLDISFLYPIFQGIHNKSEREENQVSALLPSKFLLFYTQGFFVAHW